MSSFFDANGCIYNPETGGDCIPYSNIGDYLPDFGKTLLYTAGPMSRTIVDKIFPVQMLQQYHAANHIAGLTGRWMDYTGNAVRGSFHRIMHGHHLVEDGFRVLVNPKLKFGEFLHHLGMDFLSPRGIPIPILPSSTFDFLVNCGLSKSFSYELLTINLQKLLSGSLSLVCAGNSVYACFSDAISHTFSAAGLHALYGSLDLMFGIYPTPNPFMLFAAAGEFAVSAVTAGRALYDTLYPAYTLPLINMKPDVFFPLLGQSMALGGIVGACVGLACGKSMEDVFDKTVIGGLSSGVGITTKLIAGAQVGSYIAPFIGPAAGILTALLLTKALCKSHESKPLIYQTYEQLFPSNRPAGITNSFFSNPLQNIPLIRLPEEPIGELKGDELLLRKLPEEAFLR